MMWILVGVSPWGHTLAEEWVAVLSLIWRMYVAYVASIGALLAPGVGVMSGGVGGWAAAPPGDG